MKKHLLTIATASVMLWSCGGGETATPAEETTPVQEEVVAEAPAAEVLEVTIESNDQMKYNLDRIDAMEGQTVKLTLKHVGTMAKEAMGHNWVLLAKGTDVAAFGGASAAAAATDYIPADMTDAIIANTKTLGGGEEVTIEFVAPEKGIYDFICSFPGHYSMMRGKFVVQ
jgi:azurin